MINESPAFFKLSVPLTLKLKKCLNKNRKGQYTDSCIIVIMFLRIFIRSGKTNVQIMKHFKVDYVDGNYHIIPRKSTILSYFVCLVDYSISPCVYVELPGFTRGLQAG